MQVEELCVEDENERPVSNFYEGKNVFITGGTGFIGKVLIEKLLRCTKVHRVFVLLRPKNGKDPKERMNEITNCKIFARFKSESPSLLEKLVPVGGDICSPGLGLDSRDRDILTKEVSIVFHSAAEVRFVEPIKFAVENNVVGTKRVIKFCQELDKIEAFVHVSTAYSNCQLKEVEEKIYPTRVSCSNLLDALSWIPEDILKSVTPRFLEDRPNTYTFSKALAENILLDEGGNIPICIVRPSIVIGAYKEPLRGWVEGANGPTGLTAVLSKGVIRTACVDLSKKLDCVPVDFVVNLLLVSAWKTATNKPEKPEVYNLTSSTLNPFTLDMIPKYVIKHIYNNPCRELYRYPGCRFTKSKLVNQFFMIVDHYIPGYIADLVAPLIGYKPGMVKLYKKISREFDMVNYFYFNDWSFHGEKVQSLANQLTIKEKQVFNFDVTSFNWEDCSESFVIGVREFILKDDPSTLDNGRIVLRRWYVIQKVVDLLAFGALVKLALIYSDSILDLFDAIVGSIL